MTRIAFVLTQDRGGPVDVTVTLARSLLARGDTDVAVFGPTPAGRGDALGDHLRPIEVGSKFDAGAMRRLRARVRAWRPDITHAQDRRAALVVAGVGAPNSLGIAVWTYHGVPYDVSQQWFSGSPGSRPPSGYSRAVLAADAAVARRTARVIAPSSSMGTFLRSRLRVPADTVVQIANGVDLPPASALTGPVRRLVFIGNLNPVKGLLDLLAALSRPGVMPPDATLDVVGDGPVRDHAEEIAARPPLTGRVRFLGFRPGAAELLPGYDALVMASRIEQQPLVVAQAMGAGRPVLATRVGDVPDMVDIGCGASFLAEPGDVGGLAAALVALFRATDAPTVGRRLAARARERYSAAASAEAHVELYRVMLAGRR